jgi:hypothetical protein
MDSPRALFSGQSLLTNHNSIVDEDGIYLRGETEAVPAGSLLLVGQRCALAARQSLVWARASR